MLGLEGQRAELFAALLADLQVAQTTTVMVLEDLHWADAATLDWVKFLARRIHRLPALLVLSYRDDEIDERHPLCLHQLGHASQPRCRSTTISNHRRNDFHGWH